ncbi:MAG: hypothetical protein HQK57_09590 [Deltaproteobacteria bacterium]|nr:hypothetical protein [Deltaproteobacteria bacterium]MBF0526665.1 hypothetical protein [Deltaproteobacteria bacterium]
MSILVAAVVKDDYDFLAPVEITFKSRTGSMMMSIFSNPAVRDSRNSS